MFHPDIIKKHQDRKSERELEQMSRSRNPGQSAADVGKAALAGGASWASIQSALALPHLYGGGGPEVSKHVFHDLTGGRSDLESMQGAVVRLMSEEKMSPAQAGEVLNQIFDHGRTGAWAEGSEAAQKLISGRAWTNHLKSLRVPSAIVAAIAAAGALRRQSKDRKELRELMQKTSSLDIEPLEPHFLSELQKISAKLGTLIKPPRQPLGSSIATAAKQVAAAQKRGLLG